MDFRRFLTKQKIIALILIGILITFCYIIAHRGPRKIDETTTPLSPINIEAMFYVENPDSGNVTCIGDGLINTTEEISYNPTRVSDAVVTAPDYSSFISKDNVVIWDSIQNSDSGYRVVGELTSTSAPSNKSSVIDYGAVGDGITDDSDAIIACMSENKTVVFPSGTYLVTKQLVIPNGCTLIGYGNAVIDFHGNVTKGYNYGYLVNENTHWKPSSTLAHDIKISNLTIKKSNIISDCRTIILFTNVTNVTMEKVTVETEQDDFCNTVNMLINCHNITIDHCTFIHNQYTHAGGFWIQDRNINGISYGTDNITVTNSVFIKNSGIDELIAVYTPTDSSTGLAGYVNNVLFENCKIVRNDSRDSKTRSPYLIATSLGRTNNIRFNNCTVTDACPTVGVFKFLINSTEQINPIGISNCEVTALQSTREKGSCVFYTENNKNLNTVAEISNSVIHADKKVVCCASGINLTNCDFYISNNAVALDSNNIVNNCKFYLINCNTQSRVIRNNMATINDSRLIVLEGSAAKYVIQPKELNNMIIESEVPIVVQK